MDREGTSAACLCPSWVEDGATAHWPGLCGRVSMQGTWLPDALGTVSRRAVVLRGAVAQEGLRDRLGAWEAAVRPWGLLTEAADPASLRLQAGVFCSVMVTVAMQMVKAYIVATLPAPPPFPM